MGGEIDVGDTGVIQVIELAQKTANNVHGVCDSVSTHSPGRVDQTTLPDQPEVVVVWLRIGLMKLTSLRTWYQWQPLTFQWTA